MIGLKKYINNSFYYNQTGLRQSRALKMNRKSVSHTQNQEPYQDNQSLEPCLISIHSSDDDVSNLSSQPQNVTIQQRNSLQSQRKSSQIDNNRQSAHQQKDKKQQTSVPSKNVIQSQKQIQIDRNDAQNDSQPIDIQCTIDFYDQLTQSIRDPSTSASCKVNLFEEKKQQSHILKNSKDLQAAQFSKKKQEKAVEIQVQNQFIQQKQRQSSNKGNPKEDIFNDIIGQKQRHNPRSSFEEYGMTRNSIDRMSFSDLNESSELSVNGTQSFSDFNVEDQGNSQNQNENQRSKGNFSKIKKQPFNEPAQDRVDSDEIDLWSNNEQVIVSSIANRNLPQKVKKSSFQLSDEEEQRQRAEQIIAMNKSMFTDRAKTKNTPPRQNDSKQSPKKGNLKEVEQMDQTIEQDIKKMEQSYYMQPIVNSNQKLNNLKQKKLKQTQVQNKADIEDDIQIREIDNIYFVVHKFTTQVAINQKMLHRIVQFYLGLGIMVPFFNMNLLEKQTKIKQLQLAKNQNLQKSVLNNKKDTFWFYLYNYFNFLNKRHSKHITQMFKVIKKSKGQASSFSSTSSSKKNSASFGELFNKVTDYFKKRPYSKAQILKNALEAKLQCLNCIRQEWLTQQYPFQNKQSKQIQEKLICPPISNSKLQSQISNLQMLISFEHAQLYCQKKLQQSIEKNIWKERKTRVIHDRNWFIENMFSEISI